MQPDRLHPLLRERTSPLAFDARAQFEDGALEALLAAARWAPSAGNSQPWAFIVGVRGDATHALLVEHLASSSARWAPDASALLVNLCHRYVEGTDWPYSEFAQYDVGQAVAHMTIQAVALGLSTRQFRAFDKEALTTALEIPAEWEILTMLAVGTPLSRDSSGDAPAPSRERKHSVLWDSGAAEESR